MSRRCVMAASLLLVVFGGLMVISQLLDYNGRRLGAGSIIGSFFKGNNLARISNIVERGGGINRRIDMVLPENVRVFMPDMVGPTNAARLGYYYYLTYYLFPRNVAVTLDEPRFTLNGIQGRSTESGAEMLANGFDVRVDLTQDGRDLVTRSLHTMPNRPEANPVWFGSLSDAGIAFLLPLLTALSGVWLLRLLFGPVWRMPMAEQLACGLGLGMMVVAALTLGVKLCGFHGRGWVLMLTAAGSMAELWRDRKIFRSEIADGFRDLRFNPIAGAICAAGLVVFLILFRLAALQGIAEFDAAADWLFKAKIFFFCTGNEIAGWFSNPRLAYAHLDYPTLVPSLHAATYDSIGHVDEFVTKFWPTWMLLFLLLALASLSRGITGRFHAPLFFLLGVLLLPFIQTYVQMEGGTLPMVFFTVLGVVQCAIGLVERDRARLGLGLTLLFGAAMTKFEGMIFLALTAGWMFLLPKVRALLKPSPRFWLVLGFCLLMAMPFICLRARIPALHPESGWAGYALAHPGITFSSAPEIFLIMLARLFAGPDFASWSAEDGHLNWIGQWNGLSSLYNHMTPGLPWIAVLMTIIVWVGVPSRRTIILWTLTVYVSAMIAFSVVFASFVNSSGLSDVISARTADNEAGRYLFPMLLAWATAMVILFFRDFSPVVSGTNGERVSTNTTSETNTSL